MCLEPHMITDEQFFYKYVRRNNDGEMIAPVAETILYECIGEWQSIGFWKAFRQRRQIKSNVAFHWHQLGKLFVNRYWQDPNHGEIWLVEASSKKVSCDNYDAILEEFQFLGQVIDETWTQDEKAAKEVKRVNRSAAAKKGWEARRKKACA